MTHRPKPPTEDIEWARRAAMEAMVAQATAPELLCFCSRVALLPGSLGWFRLPPTLSEHEASLVLLAWLVQGRSVPEA